MAHPFAGVALHTWTIDTAPVADALNIAKRAGFDAIELRRVDFLRAFEAGMSNAQVLALVRASGLKVAAVGVEYGWMFGRGEERQRLLGAFRECCENAVALDCKTLMSAIGSGEASVEEAVEATRIAGAMAAEFGLRLAIEFQYLHPVVDTLEKLRAIIAEAQSPAVGVLLDAYHLHRAGISARAFKDVPDEELLYFQYSDVPDAPVPSFPPTDRLPPGKGVIAWEPMLRALAHKNYRGYLSYEGPNPAQWARAPQDVATEGQRAIRQLLQATFG
jgi:sugar phosphate isomerase/epimerase